MIAEPRARMKRALGLLLAAAAAGCAQGPDVDRTPMRPAAAGRDQSPSQQVLRRLTNIENGLEVRRWIVQGDPERIGRVVTAHGGTAALGVELHERYRRDGLRLYQVPAGLVDAIATDLQPLSLSLNEWHGQIDAWRELLERPAPGRQVVAVGGRVRAFSQGAFQLLVRSWVVPMEDGPFLHIDLAPCFVDKSQRDLLLGQVRPERGEVFEGLAVTLRLDPTMAYVLTTEAPSVRWPGETGAAGVSSTQTATDRPRRRIGPGADAMRTPAPAATGADQSGPGPNVAAPLTLGTLLLGGEALPATRSVLVLVPRIAPELHPSLSVSTAGGR
jgi:hypothetical protein